MSLWAQAATGPGLVNLAHVDRFSVGGGGTDWYVNAVQGSSTVRLGGTYATQAEAEAAMNALVWPFA